MVARAHKNDGFTRRAVWCAALAALWNASFHAADAALVDPVNFQETQFISSVYGATGMAWAPDGSGRLFVISQDGVVHVVQYNAATATGTILPQDFAWFSPIYTQNECGLIGMCFDPNFLNNRYVYFLVTVSATEQQIIRYTDSAGVGTNRTVLVSGLPTVGGNHNGGGLGIGPDGRLYWAVGDRGVFTGVDTDLASLAAKVGRANRATGAALNDNPFFDGTGPNADHIWARGFRNPFSLTFQPATGKLWVNNVGSYASGGTQPPSFGGYEQALVVERGSHAGWNDYENNQPAGYLTPAIAYLTSGYGAMTVRLAAVGAVRAGGVATFTTRGTHPFRPGAKVTIAGVAEPSFNGDYYVASRVSDSQFTVAQPGAGAVSGGGTAATLDVGACITGGCFYDSTAFPAAYRGNFFVGDYVTNALVRATLDASDVPTSVDIFSTGSGNFQQIDMATGPDGALYAVRKSSGGTTGSISRIATTSSAQNIIVQPTAFDVVEGGSGVCTLRLAQPPAGNVVVSVAKLSGDADLAVSGAATRTFTPANWNQFQTITFAAAQDADRANDAAIFHVSAPALTSHDVRVNGIEDDEPQLVLSRNNVPLTEGGTAQFSVSLASSPSSSVTVTIARVSGDADLTVSSGASRTFTSANYSSPQNVTLAAAQDADFTPDTATFSVTLAGNPTRTVVATAVDDDLAAPVITSTPMTNAKAGVPYLYDVNATGNPAPTFSMTGNPASMAINPTTGLIYWQSPYATTFAVTVTATGTGTPAQQTFTIVGSNDGAPVAAITQPLAGGVVSGANAEFSGNGSDDVGTVKAEFLVDGVLRSTDINSTGSYRYGGAPTSFDTTPFTNGPHTLRLRVTDAIGQTHFQDVQVVVGNGADAWRAQHFSLSDPGDLAASALLADPDGDGAVNLLEYSADSAPKSAGLARMPMSQVVNVGGADYLALRFVSVKWATDLTYRVEATGDLAGPWIQIDPADPTYRVALQDNVPVFGLQTVTVRDVVPRGSSPRFMRLRVTK
jgi:glucose/arabinose dehydrogenase